MRPIVHFISAPTYNLCKHLNKWFRSNANFQPTYTIKNSLDLIDKISERDIPSGSILVSFDAVDLYNNVPIKFSVRRTREILSSLQIQDLRFGN